MFQLGVHRVGRTRGHMWLTRLDATVRAGTKRRYASWMNIAARDLQILRLIGGFGQLTSTQLDAIIFHQNQSRDVHTRVLRRLTEDKYLHRLNRRLPGGPKGGSGQYVYQLGSEGWRLFNRGKWRPLTSVNYHDLGIGDAYVQLLLAERAGEFDIERAVNEPETHQTIAGAEVRPDLYVELARGQARRHLYIEVDMGTERQKQLKDKLERYWHAYEHSSEEEMSPQSLVVFLVPDVVRLNEMRRVIDSGTEEQRRLFTVLLAEDYVQHLL